MTDKITSVYLVDDSTRLHGPESRLQEFPGHHASRTVLHYSAGYLVRHSRRLAELLPAVLDGAHHLQLGENSGPINGSIGSICERGVITPREAERRWISLPARQSKSQHALLSLPPRH